MPHAPDAPSPFTSAQLKTLEAVCEALTPPDSHGTAPLALATEFANYIAGALTPDELRQIGQALTLLASRMANGCFTGRFQSLPALDRPGRERLLASWANSRLPPLRAGFQVFKRLALFLCYTRRAPQTGSNPLWSRMQYPGPVEPNRAATPALNVLRVAQATSLDADAVVIGSGAGGGVVAAELAATGKRVVILEKGGYYHEGDFDGAERVASQRLFEKQCLLTTRDASMVLLAGSGLGGGTTINWMTSLPTPDYVLQQWEREYGLRDATGPTWRTSLDAVWKRLNVNTEESIPNAQNQRLIDGCTALGYHWRILPRNARQCGDCGHCNFGCRFGAKQGVLKTYLQDAAEHGAVLVPNAEVQRITVERGAATGVEAVVQGHRLTVRSKLVVAAGGSIHTPALLLRSGLSNPNIGRHLNLHPTTAVVGIYPEPIEAWHGALQTAACDHFANSGDGYGFILEVPPMHPGLAALALPWHSASGHQELMNDFSRMAAFIAITRDRDGGRVTIDRAGKPVVSYTVSRRDAPLVVQAAQEAARLHAAAGARTLVGPYNTLPIVEVKKGAVEEQTRRFAARGTRSNDLGLFSAHQMSSCRMGKDAGQAAVDPEGQTYEVRNLFVADGSALPTSTGVNPMISIMTLAHRTAQYIKARCS